MTEGLTNIDKAGIPQGSIDGVARKYDKMTETERQSLFPYILAQGRPI